jgi:hypothetical protein
MKFWSSAFLIILPALVLAACNSSQKETPPSQMRILKYSDLGAPSASVESRNFPSSQAEPRQRMVIMTADLQIEVENCNGALSKIQSIANRMSGFIVQSTTAVGFQGEATGRATLRIPSPAFDTTLSEIKNLANVLESQTIKGNDVTAEFYDVSARLENKQKVEAQFREILKSAKSVKDILDVEQALGNVREEIEQLTGRKKYLADQVQYSTININLHEPPKGITAHEPPFISKLETGFQNGLIGFEDVVSVGITILIAYGPLIIVLVLFILFGQRLLRSHRNQSSTATK